MGKPKKKLPYTGRDHNMISIIKGATKAAVHKDHKKEENKYSTREKQRPTKCRQCNFPIRASADLKDYEEDGFCSETCFDYHTTGE